MSNVGQSSTNFNDSGRPRAQAFTTGAAGATLSSVEIMYADNEGHDMAVSLCTTDSSGYPTSSCTTLTAPSSFALGTLVFTDPASTTLVATTTYTLQITSPGGQAVNLNTIPSNAEDAGAAAGWTIANAYNFKNIANEWRTTVSGTSFRIAIKGTLSTTTTTNTPATGAPTITGTAQVDQTLTAVTTGIMDADGLTSPTYTYQWIRVNGTEADIAGANSSTYTLEAADEGKTIKVQVTFDDDAGTTETLTSAATAVVAAAADATCATPSFGDRRNFWTGTMTVGPRVVGGILTGHGFSTLYSVGTSLLPDRAFSIGSNDYAFIEIMALNTGYLRVRSDSVAGLTAAHRAALRLHVCDVDYDFSAASVSGRNYTWTESLDWSSVTTRTVYLSLPANNVATGAPAITGTATVDEMLTATAGDIADTDGLPSSFTYTYQWYRVDADGTSNEEAISGETVATYTLTDDDIGKRIKVKVSFTDNLNGKETRTSAATTVVAAAADATCAASSFGDRRNFWTGTVTVAPVNVGTTTGHGFSTTYGPGSSLRPDRRFSIGSNAYQIYEISARSTGALRFSTSSGFPLSAAHRAALRLHVCDVDYDFSAATIRGGGNYNWSGSLDWSSVTTRTVYLSLPANNVATGAPAITGTATVDEMLTATAGDIADTDGLPSSSTYTYQWFRVDADGTSNEEEISGETVATYTLTDDDIGKRIKVKVSFTDNLNGKETRTSAATAVVATTPPEVVSVVVNSQGKGLSIRFDKALDEDAARAVPASAYVVTVDGQDVTITVTAVFFGDTVSLSVPGAAIRQYQTVVVSYTDPTAGNDTVALQDLVGNDVAGFTTGKSGVPAVTNGSTVPSTDTTPPEVEGVVVDEVNMIVSIVFDEALDEDAGGAVPVSAYAVTADGQDVEITHVRIGFGNTVILEFPDAAIRQGQTVVVSYTDPTAGNDTVALQDRVGNDVASFTVTANIPATGAPTITGTVEVGQTLTAVTTGIMDANGLTGVTYDYQWIRVNGTDAAIGLATSSTYLLVAADLGKTIKVEVGFRDADGYLEMLTSAATAVVAPDTSCAAPDLAGRERIWTGTVTVGQRTVSSTVVYGFQPGGGDLLPSKRLSIGGNNYTITNIAVTSVGSATFGIENATLTATERGALRLHLCDVPYDLSTASLIQSTYYWTGGPDWSSFRTRTVYLSLPDGYPEPPARAPGAPTGLSAQSVSGKPGYLRLSWTPGPAPGGSLPPIVTDYEARYRKTGAPDWSPTWSFRDYGTPGFAYPPGSPAAPRGGNDAPLIYYLDPNTEYEVEVRATNSYGESGWSNRVSATTAQATTADDDGTADADNGSGPAAAPSQPTVRRVANEPGLMVRWNAPRTASIPTGYTFLDYEVEIEKERERNRLIWTLRKSYLYVVESMDGGLTPPLTYLLIPGLEPNTAYTVRVRAVSRSLLTLTDEQDHYSPWSPDQSGTTATGRANNIQLSLEFPPGGTRSMTAAPGAKVTYRVKATGIHDWAAVRARGGIGKAQIRIWEHGRHHRRMSYYRSTKGITHRHFIHQTGSSGYLEGAFTVPDEAGAGASGTIEIHLIPPSSRCGGTGTGPRCSVGSTVGSVNRSRNKLCIAVERSGDVAHPCSSGQTQAVAPTVEGTPGLSASGSDGSWTPGQTVEAIVTFSEAVTVDTSSGTPAITLTLGGTLEQSARYTRGSGSKALVFAYTLIESDGSHTAMGVKPDSLALNGGSITSEASGADADLGHNGAIIMGERDGGRGVRGVRGVPERTGPTASFSDLPATHDGEKAFTVKLSFSAEPRGLSYKTVRDSLLEVSCATESCGTVTKALRVTDESDREWNVTVEPSQAYAITLTLPPRACSETAAVCVGGRPLARPASATIPGEPLTAILTGPAEHDGSESFEVRLTFSMEPDVSYKTVRDTMFTENGGAISGARRVKPPHDREFDIVVKPGGNAAVSLALASPLPACGEPGAVCTAGGRKIEGTVSATIPGPVAISVADARVREGPGAKLAFEVTLDRARSQPVRVDYATGNGEAKAVSDYVAASGILTFSANETSKTVEVEVVADEVDEDSETMTLTLTNPVGARIADGTATGTITNTGHIPQAWIARFGRTVADQVLDAVDARLRAARTAGASVSLGGQRIGGAAPKVDGQANGQAVAAAGPDSAGTSAGKAGPGPGSKPASLFGAAADAGETARLKALSDWLRQETAADDRPRGWSRTLTGRQMLMGSSFSLAAETDGGGFAGLWGRMAQARFAGREDALSLDGDVTTGLLGADYAWGRWTSGLVVSHSIGEGGYRGDSTGEIEATVTALTPWAGYKVTEGLSVWGAAGYGAGGLKLTPGGDPALKTDLGMMLAAAGARGTLVGGEGPRLDAVTDARWVRTTTARVSSSAGNLASASASVTRLRLGLEGWWPLALGDGVLGKGVLGKGATVTPRLALGVRHDGGDAETGFGADISGGVTLAAPAEGLTVSLDGRGVLTHEASGLRDRGIAGTLAWNPPPSTGRGPKLTLSQTFGAGAASGKDALLSRTTLEGLAAHDNGAGQRRLEARFGYGFGMFGGRFTGTPEIGLGFSDAGRDYSLGWRLTRAGSAPGSLELSIDATRRESVNDNAPPEHGIGARLTARF